MKRKKQAKKNKYVKQTNQRKGLNHEKQVEQTVQTEKVNKMQLKIELISDLICGSGEGWGNVIDTDVVYDSYGFPYIPAKRIKGILREECLELDDMNIYDHQFCDEIFGNDSVEDGKFTLTNAVLKDVDHMKDYIKYCDSEEKKELNISNVINHYTNVRCQTAIDDNGIARENSLRSSRAIMRGNVFYSDIVYDEKYKNVIKQCCSMVHHMGINRTRGFGDVRVSLENNNKNVDRKKTFELKSNKRYVLKLRLKNKSQLSIKTCRGDRSADYISGGAILGFFAGRYLKDHKADEEFYRLFIKDNEDGLIFENAYISDNMWNEYVPGRISLYKEKTGTALLDQSVDEQDTSKIWTRVRNKYMCINSNNIIQPDKEMVYHHRRPDDKSIGHVIDNNGTDTGMFYQREVISQDQYFIANIKGTGADIKQIFSPDLLQIQIGGSKHTQYGDISIEGFELIPEKKESINKGTEVVCTLESPLVILDNKGESILDVGTLENVLGLREVSKCFIDYVSIGGYNAKWKMQKPSYTAFAPGSCIRGVLEKDTDNVITVGVFTHEGMGKVMVETIDKVKDYYKNKKSLTDENKDCKKNGEKIPKDLKDILINAIRHKMRLNVLEELKNKKPDKMITPALIGRLLKMLENNTWQTFKEDYEGIAAMEKKEEVSRYIEEVRKKCDQVTEESGILNYVEDDDEQNEIKEKFCMLILKDKFTLAKYERRNKE